MIANSGIGIDADSLELIHERSISHLGAATRHAMSPAVHTLSTPPGYTSATCRWLLLIALLATLPLSAYAEDSLSPIKAAVTDFLTTRLMDPTIDIIVDIRGNALAFDSCLNPVPFLAREDAPLWGRITVGVACDEPPSPRFLQTRVIAQGDILVAATDIAPGALIDASMLTAAPGRLGGPTSQAMRDPDLAVGMEARRRIPAGAPIQERLLKAPVLVERGRAVTLELKGVGFVVTRDARAMDSGGLGEVVRVKLDQGTTLSATVTGIGAATASR